MSDKLDAGVDHHGRVANHPDEFRATADELDTFDPGLALGYFRRLEVLLEASPVRIYAASSLKHPWPYRLQNAAESYPASFWRSQDRIMDSAISKDLTNAEVLEHAVDRHATAVVAKDHLHDRDATTESIREFVDVHHPEKHPRAYIPLQPPYDEHVADVYPIIEESHLDHRYMLGGLKDAPTSQRVDSLLEFREAVGAEPEVHGLGWGLDDELVSAVREEPTLLDSVDNSTLSQALRNGRIVDKRWQARPFGVVDEGQYQNTTMGAFEFACLVQATHRMTRFNEEFGVKSQSTVADFGGVQADD
ncbi:hypothetical protein [Halanaeroarchaeum sp. HSR-CO]|uniref:hypothetical protein n=1 Tax=Halanaeroarchaeum sp. HSR-CO TaxID=2866382 RepID=UPI00217E1D13|nr:hypothetical protein [Halanaeroarchaeum sp. HSR-CO]